jgi:hypothetical protein
MPAVPHEVVLLEIPVDADFADFRAEFERAVPRVDHERMEEIIDAGASWDEVESIVAEKATHDFMIYSSLEGRPFSLAGHDPRCAMYLMGNHVIAERIYAHSPAALLYVPLRVALYVDSGGQTIFATDQPSTTLAGLRNADITAVGCELDQKLAALLTALGVTPPQELWG